MAVREALGGNDVPPVDLTTGSGRCSANSAGRALSGPTELAVVVLTVGGDRRRKRCGRISSPMYRTIQDAARFDSRICGNVDRCGRPGPRTYPRFLETIQRNATQLRRWWKTCWCSRAAGERPPVKKPIVVSELIREQTSVLRRALAEKTSGRGELQPG